MANLPNDKTPTRVGLYIWDRLDQYTMANLPHGDKTPHERERVFTLGTDWSSCVGRYEVFTFRTDYASTE